MITMAGRLMEKARAKAAALKAADDAALSGDADRYRQALQGATYKSLGPEFTQGLNRITSGLAGAGPLADSGAATALRARLAGDIYGRASGSIGMGYANYLGDLLRQRRQFNYQKQLLAYQKKLNKKSPVASIASAIGGIGGALVGGPAGAAVGSQIGGGIGGGTQANDAYYG